MSNQNAVVQKMLDTGYSYEKVSQELNNLARSSDAKHLDLFIPSYVNGALALEIYFKAIYLFTIGEKYKNSHDFSKLFKELKKEDQEALKTLFDKIISPAERLSIKIRSEVTARKSDDPSINRIEIPTEWNELLKIWSTVFTEVRYVYEDRDKNYCMVFFPQIAQTLREYL